MKEKKILLDIDEVQDILDELACELPQEVFNELNGGIYLLPDRKLSEYDLNGDLYNLGAYHHSHSMGRYIVIYYGSYEAIYSHLSREALKDKLRDTLRHEFLHHVESLAGEKDLEVEDARQLARYKYRAHLRQLKDKGND
jgi:hypothetical protein